MVRIYVVDNGGQWTHREWRTLKYLNVETKIVPNTIPYDTLLKENVHGLVLSGGTPRIGLQPELGNCGEYLEKADFPILGICAGHQFIALHFGGDAQPAQTPEFGKVELHLHTTNHPLFHNVPETSIVWESHHDEVTRLPKEFILLAESESCKVQAMSHKKQPFYGLQFHPEVDHTEYGEQIFTNFVTICTP